MLSPDAAAVGLSVLVAAGGVVRYAIQIERKLTAAITKLDLLPCVKSTPGGFSCAKP